MFERDLVAVFEAAGGGTFGVDIVAGAAAPVPTGAGPIVRIRDTQGVQGERTQNQRRRVTERPSVQVLVCAGDAGGESGLERAKARARLLYDACQDVKNDEVSGTTYLEMDPQQPPFDLGVVDSEGRAQVVFNVLGWHRT